MISKQHGEGTASIGSHLVKKTTVQQELNEMLRGLLVDHQMMQSRPGVDQRESLELPNDQYLDLQVQAEMETNSQIGSRSKQPALREQDIFSNTQELYCNGTALEKPELDRVQEQPPDTEQLRQLDRLE